MALIEARLGLVHPKAVVRAKPETEEICVVTIDVEFIGVSHASGSRLAPPKLTMKFVLRPRLGAREPRRCCDVLTGAFDQFESQMCP